MNMMTHVLLMALVLGFTISACNSHSFESCKELTCNAGVRRNGAYKVGCKARKVYCHMEKIVGCGAGPWTLVMKIDGKKRTFEYRSPLWTNRREYLPQNGLTGFDDKETKLSTFYNTPFDKICLGMKQDCHLRFFALNVRGRSLHSLIADGKFRQTRVAKSSWEGLLATKGRLQNNCNQQGFNVFNYVRIGIRSNQENDCNSCDSWIGFGGNRYGGNTCGNYANGRWMGNGLKGANEKLMGYILVQ